mgnify:CR=1 FL=1
MENISIKYGFPSFIIAFVFFPRDVAFLSRNGTVKCSQLYGCVDYRYLIKGKVHLIRGKLVHFPGKKGEMAVKSTFSAGKCTKKAGKWFTSPPKKTDEEYRWEQYSRGTGQKEKGMLKRKRVS